MNEQQQQRQSHRRLSRAADFVFGVPMLLFGVWFFAIPFLKGVPGGVGDLPMVLAIGSIAFCFWLHLIFRRRVEPPDT